MRKFLLVILLVITGFKLIADSGALAYKYATVKLYTQDEEGKNEDDKHSKGKCDNEDIFYPFYVVYALASDPVQILPFSYSHNKLHSGFVDKPYTPPDLTSL